MVTPVEPKGLDESESETKNLVCSCRRRMSGRTPVRRSRDKDWDGRMDEKLDWTKLG